MKPFLHGWIIMITVGALMCGVFCNQGNAEEADVKSGVVEPEKDEEILVFYQKPYPEKGMKVSFPKTVSVSEKGKKFKCEYMIANHLGESVFLASTSWGGGVGYDDGETISYEGSSGEYRKTLYALVHSGVMKKKDQGTLFSTSHLSVVHHVAEFLIPEHVKPGGIITISITIYGYYMRTGRGFSGSLDLPIKVTE